MGASYQIGAPASFQTEKRRNPLTSPAKLTKDHTVSGCSM